MPIYEYACQTCLRVTEVIHGRTAPGPDRCDACGGPLVKLMSAPAVHFKGSGWAKKDAHDTAAKRVRPEAGKADAGAKTETRAGADDGADASGHEQPKADQGARAKADQGAPAPSGAPSATGGSAEADG